eukprot:6002983-Pyramimonas_sp.AAC.1
MQVPWLVARSRRAGPMPKTNSTCAPAALQQPRSYPCAVPSSATVIVAAPRSGGRVQIYRDSPRRNCRRKCPVANGM